MCRFEFIRSPARPRSLGAARFGSHRSSTDRSTYGCRDFLRQVHRFEELCRIKVVLTGLIDHSDKAMRRCVIVEHSLVDLPQLERCWIACVSHADDESLPLSCTCHGESNQGSVFDPDFLSTNSRGLVPDGAPLPPRRRPQIARWPFPFASASDHDRTSGAGAADRGLPNGPRTCRRSEQVRESRSTLQASSTIAAQLKPERWRSGAPS